ncbi:Sec20-domain-containing protein, partial [Mycena sp. CBHHK59/15]
DEETAQLIAAAHRHQTDLAEFQIPRLRSCQGPLSLQQNLAAELREDVDTFARQIEALDVLIGDQKGPKNRRELEGIVDEFNESLASLRREARAALLASKRTIDSFTVSEKQDPNEKVTDDALMAASDNVTTALQRTIGLMQGELERSVLSTQMLDSSTTTLRSASSTHDTLTGVMDTSKQLITALEKSDWLDRILIFSALFFFILVVLFILKQRIFDRGMRIAFCMEKGSATALSVTLASSAASAVSVLASSTTTSESIFFAEHTPEVFDVPVVSEIADSDTPLVPDAPEITHVEL